MDIYPNILHLVIYYDKDLGERDGNPWCVEFSDSEVTNRFSDFTQLQTFIHNVAGHLTTDTRNHV